MKHLCVYTHVLLITGIFLQLKHMYTRRYKHKYIYICTCNVSIHNYIYIYIYICSKMCIWKCVSVGTCYCCPFFWLVALHLAGHCFSQAAKRLMIFDVCLKRHPSQAWRHTAKAFSNDNDLTKTSRIIRFKQCALWNDIFTRFFSKHFDKRITGLCSAGTL